MTRNNLLTALAVLVLVIVALVGFWFFTRTTDDAETAGDGGASAVQSGGETTSDGAANDTAAGNDQAAETATTDDAAGAGAKPGADDATAPAADAPSFDIVRVEPDGGAVIAGRATPGAEVLIYDGDTLLGAVTADERGEWVFVPEAPLAPGDRELSIVARLPDGREVGAGDVVVLSVPEAAAGAEGGNAGAGGAPAKTVGPVAVLTPKAGGPSRVLQGPVQIEPIAAAKGLNLWAVDYIETTGRLTMSGVAEPEARVFLYLDNEFLGEANAGADGDWQLSVTRQIAEGEYPMRVDLVGEEGKVLARLEVPFIYLPQGFLAVGNRVTVRPGNSLWRIARRVYGEGVQYTTIYDANKAKIIDADRIFPGQVFVVPQGG